VHGVKIAKLRKSIKNTTGGVKKPNFSVGHKKKDEMGELIENATRGEGGH